MGRLDGKIALVTGGTSGIGLATVRLFLAEGAKVALTGRDEVRLGELRAEFGPEVLVLGADVANLHEMEGVAREVAERWGALDVVFANAGVFRATGAGIYDPDTVDVLLSTNVKGVLNTVQSVLPLLRRGASVVFTSSTVDDLGSPGMAVYAATKAAVRSLARTLSAELVDRGIRVNVVAPGPIETPIWNRSGIPAEIVPAMADGIRQTNPMKRFGSAEEIARTALFLASDDSSYMLGERIAVDGGAGSL